MAPAGDEIFQNPQFPQDLSIQRFSLRVSVDKAILSDAFSPGFGLDQLDESGTAHASYLYSTKIDGREARFDSLIGVHRKDDDEPDDYWVHADFGIRLLPESESRKSAKWDRLFEFVGSILGTHPVRIRLDMGFPKDEASYAVSIPIALGPSDVPGFSEIRGVRLVQLDDADPTKELYSLILDQIGISTSATVSTSIEGPLGRDLLVRAAERALEVAALAIRPVGSNDDSDS